MASPLTYSDLWFTASPTDHNTLRGYSGTTLRGAFGFALRHVACHTRHQDCDRCLLSEHCAYSVVFEGVPPSDRRIMRKYPRVPQPFVLLVPDSTGAASRDERLRFGIRLFGPAAAAYPYVVQAVKTMLERGLGRDRAPFALEEVSDGQSLIYRSGDSTLRPAIKRSVVIEDWLGAAADTVEVTCLTPLRLKVDGRIARHLALGPLFRAVVRRARLLWAFYGDGDGEVETPGDLLDAADEAPLVFSDLRWRAIRRYSGRQKRRMAIGGLTGRARFQWPPGAAGPQGWLEVASVTHVGKATTFGFGRLDYNVEPS